MRNIEWLIIALAALVILLFVMKLGRSSQHPSAPVQPPRKPVNLQLLPPKFIVLDLETTGLDPDRNEIIEIGAIRVNRDSDNHDTFRTLVKPTHPIPRRITQINGISQDMVDRDGMALDQALREFVDFIGDLPLVTFNAEFDMAFLLLAAKRHNIAIANSASCALKLARLAWPNRESYKLADLARDGGLSEEGMHHALDDCRRALIVYIAAVSILGTATPDEVRYTPVRSGPSLSPRMRAYRQFRCIPTGAVDRNLLGMEFEADGLVDKAIECYQANVRDGFDRNYPYDRLAIIFRRRGDFANEMAVLSRAIEVFSQLPPSRLDVAKLEKFRKRLDRTSTLSKKTLLRSNHSGPDSVSPRGPDV